MHFLFSWHFAAQSSHFFTFLYFLMTFWPLVFIFFIGHGGGGSVVVPEVVLDADGDVVVVLGVVDVVLGVVVVVLGVVDVVVGLFTS